MFVASANVARHAPADDEDRNRPHCHYYSAFARAGNDFEYDPRMIRRTFTAILITISLFAARGLAELPAPPTEMTPWPLPYTKEAPGVTSASDLLDKPAGKLGPVVARDGHFFTGEKRIRFWGVNIAFAGNFPTHEQADAVAARLARHGINAVRLHHLDFFPYPNGIWADEKLETISPEARDRLEYFIAALKREGIYSNINLHVSRSYPRAHEWPSFDKIPSPQSMLDMFYPTLIDLQKQYAKDLLDHVNPHTNLRLADDPAVAIVEIDNENSLFMWNSDTELANLPSPYADVLQKLWNDWLIKKYGSREKLSEAWATGAQPMGPNLLVDPKFEGLAQGQGPWFVELHEPSTMTATINDGTVKLDVTNVDGTDWHLQFNQANLKLKKGQYYTASFKAKASKPTKIGFNVNMAHEPWQTLGLMTNVSLTTDLQEFRFGLIAPADDENARVTFVVGGEVLSLSISEVQLREGGQTGLAEFEDPAANTVARKNRGRPETAARISDWNEFLQHTDESFYVEMRRFLKEDIGVKGAITGTIGFGPCSTLSQTKMDFVDQHSYWDHPSFPHKSWDPKDWQIENKPMVDNLEKATLWPLAATRVAGKPFTVTEYMHAAPNEYAAECVPMIATFAALQDWDGVFLFAYTHDSDYEKKKIDSFFNIEGNPLKMPMVPIGARIFLGQKVEPIVSTWTVHVDRATIFRTPYIADQWAFVRNEHKIAGPDLLAAKLALSFDPGESVVKENSRGADNRLEWKAAGEDTASGRYVLNDPHAIVFVGFAKPALFEGDSKSIEIGPLKIESMQSPFASLMLVPTNPTEPIATAKSLLLSAVGRGGNTNMKWDEARRTFSDQWGDAPQVEVIKAKLSVAGSFKVFALTPEGKRGNEVKSESKDGKTIFEIGGEPTIGYELSRD